jgi:hypothetical protein
MKVRKYNSRHLLFLILLLVSPILQGGYGSDDGCSGESWDKPERRAIVTPEPDADESDEVPDECLTHIDDAVRKAQPCASQPVCATPVIDAAGLADLEKELASARAELIELKARRMAPDVKNPRLIKTVKVKSGWWMGRYVTATPGADPQATRVCNGFTAVNPKIHPGQSLKICGW